MAQEVWEDGAKVYPHPDFIDLKTHPMDWLALFFVVKGGYVTDGSGYVWRATKERFKLLVPAKPAKRKGMR